MLGYFVLPTVSVCLKSEAMVVQHNAFQKQFALCSFVKHTFFLWIDHFECVFCTLWMQEYIMCVLHWLQTWICLSEIKTLSGLWQDVECGAHLNSIVSHSSPRKASLDMHWCVLDLVISSANCHEGKFRCWCAVVLLKRDTHAQTNSDSYNCKHSNTHARSLIILGPSCEERRLIWSNVTWKITHSQDTVFKRQSPYSSFILKRTRVLPWIFCEGVKIRSVIKSKINDKISVLLKVKSQLG